MKYIIAGIFGGIVGGMGMGGGTLLIPTLSLILGVEQKVAQLLNMISFIPMAILTIIFNAKSKLIKWQYIIYVGISATLASIGSSFLVGYIDSKYLKIAFGIFLVILGLYFISSTIYKMVRQRRGKTLVSINMKKVDDDN